MEHRLPAYENRHKTLPPETVAVFGGSFNPPGLHHLHIATALLDHFDRVLIVPCGFRPGKIHISHDHVPDSARRQMVDVTFSSLVGSQYEIDYRDLDTGIFTATVDLAEAYRDQGQLWFVVGADLFKGGKAAQSEIQSSWKRGPWIWDTLNFACVTRPGFVLDPGDLPLHHRLIELDINGSSSEIRTALRNGTSIQGLVVPEVYALLEKSTWYRES